MDDQQIAVCVCASSDADVGIIRIKDQIAGLGFAPRNIRAVAVLHGRVSKFFPVTVALVFGSNMLVKLSPTLTLSRGSAKTTSAIEERISRSPYKEMDIFRKSVLLGSMGCGFTYGDAYENASGQLTLTYKMPLEL